MQWIHSDSRCPPTHAASPKKAVEDTPDRIRMSVYCIPLEKAKNKLCMRLCERWISLQYLTKDIFSSPPECAMRVTMSHFVFG